MSIKKQFLKSKPVCKVTFKVSSEDANGSKSVKVVGDFNNWDKNTAPMKTLKSGDFTQTIALEAGKTYEFKYLLEDDQWLNDADADGKVNNDFNTQNDIVSTVK